MYDRKGCLLYTSSAKENADFLKNEYGWGGVYPAIVGADIDEQHNGKDVYKRQR